MKVIVWYGGWAVLFVGAALAVVGIVLLVLLLKARRDGKEDNKKRMVAAGTLLVAALLCAGISSMMRSAVLGGLGAEVEYVDGDGETGTELEWHYGTLQLYGEDGDVIFEYEGQYQLDEANCHIVYWEDGVECEFWYAEGCTVVEGGELEDAAETE